jgi:nitrite reductase (NO-forming)
MVFKTHLLILVLSLLALGCSQSKPLEYSPDLAVQIQEGQKIYLQRCAVCHKSEGQGKFKKYPPLANSDWLRKDVKTQAISSIKNGKRGQITVNGVEYNGVMPALPLSDIEITYVLNFIYNSWGNNKTRVTLEDVQAVDENTFSGLKTDQ